jgi:2,5-dihydroxypyridine 5,6-dioxygenase
MSIIEMAPTAKIIIEQVLGVKPRDSVCILTDTGRSKDITEILAASVRAAGGEVVIATMVPREVGGIDPPAPAAAAMLAADVVLAQASFGIIHTETTRNVLKRGGRLCDMWGFTEDMMTHGGATADYVEVNRLSRLLEKILASAKKARLTTKDGTDVTFVLQDRPAHTLAGMATKPGQFCAFPDGEAAISPVEGTTEGIMVNPFAMERADLGYLKENITLKIKGGKVVAIEGGAAASTLLKVIEPIGDTARNIAELGLGTNPKCRIGVTLREGKKTWGTAHIAMGDNKSLGGVVECPMHMDIIFREPTVTVDNQTLVKDGKVIV